MKKNTLVLSVMIGLTSMAALYTVLTDAKESQYFSRDSISSSRQTEANNEFFEIMRRNEKTGKVESEDYYKAVNEVNSLRGSRAALGLNWSYSGPDNVGGLTRGIVVDNEDPTRIYAGGEGGGIFVSTNSAGSWTYKSDGWSNINVSSVAQDGNGRLYVGTGIGYKTIPGGGVFVSDDRGETWSLLSSTVPSITNNSWTYVNRIVISKEKNTLGNYTVYVGTTRGLEVSLDNGATWIQPMTLPNCVNALQGNVNDVIISENGRVLVAYSGRLYVSDAGEAICSYTEITDGIGGSSRMSLAVCPNDGNVVYAYQGFNNPRSFQVLKSVNGGDTWGLMQPAPPTPIIDSTFNILGYNSPSYNQAIGVDPNNCDNIYVGAVDLYRVSGAWTSVAIGGQFAQNFYVHVDHHWIQYDPTNGNRMYEGNDGGVFKTENAGAGLVTWTSNNRGYGTTLYYGVATSPTGQIIGGSQDNGNHAIDPNQPGISGKDGRELWTLGDGFDCDASSLGNIAFVTSQYGNIGKDSYLSGGSGGVQIHIGGQPGTGGVSPFNTVIRLWESKNDLTSKDSVVFVNDTSRFSVGNGDGNKQIFTGTLRRDQAAAKIIPGTVHLVDIAGGQFADDISQPGILRSFGDSVGFVDYATGEFSVRWNFAPPVGSSVNSVFNVKFNAGDTLRLVSQNQSYPFTYVLTSSLLTTDSIKAQDPVQSLLVVSMNDGIDISRETLYEGSSPAWIGVTTIVPNSFEFSKDGNHLYAGGYNGQVVRISGLNDLYTGVSPDSVLTKTTIFNGSSAIGGLCIHPTDPGKLLITTGGFGSTDHVYELTNAQNASSASNAGSRPLGGNLPDFPVYDPEYNVNKPNQVLLGTELGVWATDDISSNNPTWTQEIAGLGNVRVLDVLQQRLPFSEAQNYGQFYLGTYGRGIWTSTDLVGFNDKFDDFSDDVEISTMKLYPNPVIAIGKVVFDMPVNGSAEIMIYDISGKVVQQTSQNYAKGEATFEFAVNNMPAGTYFFRMKVGSAEKHAKFVVVK